MAIGDHYQLDAVSRQSNYTLTHVKQATFHDSPVTSNTKPAVLKASVQIEPLKNRLTEVRTSYRKLVVLRHKLYPILASVGPVLHPAMGSL